MSTIVKGGIFLLIFELHFIIKAIKYPYAAHYLFPQKCSQNVRGKYSKVGGDKSTVVSGV